jgi:hypothetical protein
MPAAENARPSDYTYSVLVLDMAHTHDAESEQTVHGFATVEAARAYAEARTRASVEELRGRDTSPAEIRTLWHLYGEDCIVPGDSYRGGDALDLYIAVPAAAEEIEWQRLTPRLKRFLVAVLVSNASQNSVWTGGFINRYVRPSKETLMAIFRSDAAAEFRRKRYPDAEPRDLHVAKLHELFDPPRPPSGLALENWHVAVDFVCHDIKFGSSHDGVFAWPERPAGEALDQMIRLLIGDKIALRGDGPENVDYSEVVSVKVEKTDRAVDYPPAETPVPRDETGGSAGEQIA